MKVASSLVVSVMLVLLLVSSEVAASEAPSSRNDNRGGPPASIVNRALDLLAQPVFLEQDTDHATWQSREFDTSQFDTVALKHSAEMISGSMRCAIAWKLGSDDTFVDPLPGDSGLASGANASFATPQVLGTSGKVFCRPFQPCPLGCDRPGFDAPSAAGTLTDVKILLRRQ